MKKSLIFAGMLCIGYANAQYDGKVGINTNEPKATLEVQPNATNLAGTTNEGIITPRLSKTRIANIETSKLTEGTLVYATDDTTSPISAYTGNDTKVAKITEKGYYFYNGIEWVKIQYQDKGSRWINDTTNNLVKLDTYSNGTTARTDLNNIRITDSGKFFLGREHNSTIEANSKLQVEGAIKSYSIATVGSGNVGSAIRLYNSSKEENSQAYQWTIYNMTDTDPNTDGGYKNALVFWNYNKNNAGGTEANKPQFFILDNGNVSVGGSPYAASEDLTEKLTVHGTIKSTTLAGGRTKKVVYATADGVLTTSTEEVGATTLTGTTDLECNNANRGKMNFVKDVTIGSGTGDAFAVCLKGTDGKFYWRYLYGAAGVTNATGNFGAGL